jgi:hypothetical protein
MTSINPFSGYVAQGAQVERAQAGDKSREVRRTQALSSDVARRDDELEHQVESADAIVSIHDEQPSQQQQQPRKDRPKSGQGDEDDQTPSHIDVTA